MTEKPTKTAALSEREIISCLKESLGAAAANCDRLAKGERGMIYVELRAQLRSAEGAARQMCHWREDGRWLPFGIKLFEVQQRCGRWLREKQPGWRFQGLAEILRFALKQAIDLETKATGRIGPILPVARCEIITDSRPTRVILPDGFKRETGDALH